MIETEAWKDCVTDLEGDNMAQSVDVMAVVAAVNKAVHKAWCGSTSDAQIMITNIKEFLAQEAPDVPWVVDRHGRLDVIA